MPQVNYASMTTPASTNKIFTLHRAIPRLVYDFFKEVVFLQVVFLVWDFSVFTIHVHKLLQADFLE